MLATFKELKSCVALRDSIIMSILLRNEKMQLILGQNKARKYAIRGVCSHSFGFYNILSE